MAQGYGSQQMAPMQFEASSGPQTVPHGYSSETKASGEAYWAQGAHNPAPQQDAGFHWPQQQYGFPECNYAPNYMHYPPQQSFPAFQEPPAMPDMMYPNFQQQFHPAYKPQPYHAPYQHQFAYPPGVPHFQGQYPMYPQQQHRPVFPPMMMDSPQPSPYWNRIHHEPWSNQSAPGRASGAPTCDFPGCGRVYTTVALLKAHMKTHLDEEMYCCNWGDCGQKFATSDELARHIQQHFPFSLSPP